MTAAMSEGRYPCDEPLSHLGVRQIRALGDLGSVGQVLVGPESRTRQTAELLGCRPDVERNLCDLDYGSWRGASLDGIDPDDLRRWINDPISAPHGGESIAALLARVAGWLDTVSLTPHRTVAVTHPAVVRAAIIIALNAPPESFWRIDAHPASRTVLHHRMHCWTLRLA